MNKLIPDDMRDDENIGSKIIRENAKMFYSEIDKKVKEFHDMGFSGSDFVIEFPQPEYEDNKIIWKARVRLVSENEKQLNLEREIAALERLMKQMDKVLFETYVTTA